MYILCGVYLCMYVCMYVGEQVWHGGEAVSCRGEQSQSEDCRSAKQVDDEPARYRTNNTNIVYRI